MNVFEAVKNVVIGRARSLSDKSLFHKTSLIALLAWVGLGADGRLSHPAGASGSGHLLTRLYGCAGRIDRRGRRLGALPTF